MLMNDKFCLSEAPRAILAVYIVPFWNQEDPRIKKLSFSLWPKTEIQVDRGPISPLQGLD